MSFRTGDGILMDNPTVKTAQMKCENCSFTVIHDYPIQLSEFNKLIKHIAKYHGDNCSKKKKE